MIILSKKKINKLLYVNILIDTNMFNNFNSNINFSQTIIDEILYHLYIL